MAAFRNISLSVSKKTVLAFKKDQPGSDLPPG
jgi:hypothetical protein